MIVLGKLSNCSNRGSLSYEEFLSRSIHRGTSASEGAGIELPAFARRIVCTPDSFFQLPEVAMGLVPGAGGTVSLPRRIGRQRTAAMALSRRRVDAHDALHWGLVDAIEPR